MYEPDVVDLQDDFALAPDIESACWRFMKGLQQNRLTVAALEVVEGIAKATESQGDIRIDVTDVWEDLQKIRGLGDMHSDWSEELGDVVECYVAPADFTIGTERISKGSWLLGVVWSPDQFKKIETGERTGLSMGGRGQRVHA